MSVEEIKVFIKVFDGGRIPAYQSAQAAGCDVYAAEDLVLLPGETKLCHLHFSMAMEPGVEAQVRPRSGLSLRTSLRVPNSPGTIDSDYRDEVAVIVENTFHSGDLPARIASDPGILEQIQREYKAVTLREYLIKKYPEKGTDCYDAKDAALKSLLNQYLYIDGKGNPYGTIYIQKGERIAQIIFARHCTARFIPHPNPRSIGQDRGGGFGHTMV